MAFTEIQVLDDIRTRRKAAPLAASPGATINEGMICMLNSSGELVVADGAAYVPSPKIVLAKASRGDIIGAGQATPNRGLPYVEGPVLIDIGTQAYDGSPTFGQKLGIGTSGTIGKFVVLADQDIGGSDADDLANMVGVVEKAPDADGKMRVRVTR